MKNTTFQNRSTTNRTKKLLLFVCFGLALFGVVVVAHDFLAASHDLKAVKTYKQSASFIDYSNAATDYTNEATAHLYKCSATINDLRTAMQGGNGSVKKYFVQKTTELKRSQNIAATAEPERTSWLLGSFMPAGRKFNANQQKLDTLFEASTKITQLNATTRFCVEYAYEVSAPLAFQQQKYSSSTVARTVSIDSVQQTISEISNLQSQQPAIPKDNYTLTNAAQSINQFLQKVKIDYRAAVAGNSVARYNNSYKANFETYESQILPGLAGAGKTISPTPKDLGAQLSEAQKL